MAKKNFAMIGVGGFIAPRHLQAIHDTGHVLTACADVSDSVGIIDSYFPDARFYTDVDAFDRDLAEQQRSGGIDYLTVCTPNHLHADHSRMGMT